MPPFFGMAKKLVHKMKTLILLLLCFSTLKAEISVSFPDSTFAYSKTTTNYVTLPVKIADVDSAHELFSFQFHFFYHYDGIKVTNVTLLQSGNFEFSVKPDGELENEIVSGACILNSQLVGNSTLLNVTFEIPPNTNSGTSKNITWADFSITPNLPQIQLSGGNLTIAKQGDFDQNNVTDSLDAKILLKKIVQKSTLNGYQKFVADFDANGKIQPFDAAKILEFVEFGFYETEIPSFATPTFTGNFFATNTFPFNLSLNLQNAVSVASLSGKIKFSKTDFSLDSLKIGNFNNFLFEQRNLETQDSTEIFFAFASGNSFLSGNLKLSDFFLTTEKANKQSTFSLENFTTNTETNTQNALFSVNLVPSNDSLEFYFSGKNFYELKNNSNPSVNLFLNQTNNLDTLTLELEFETEKTQLTNIRSPYFEQVYKTENQYGAKITAVTEFPTNFSGNIFQFSFFVDENASFSGDSLKISLVKITANLPNTVILKEKTSLLLPFLAGDFDKNNLVNQNDFNGLLVSLAGFSDFTDFEKNAVDFDKSKNLTSFDAFLLQNFLGNKPLNFDQIFEGKIFLENQQNLLEGEKIILKISSQNSKNILSLRGKIEFNSEKLDFLNLPLENVSNFKLAKISSDEIGFCFVNFDSLLKTDTTFLEIFFTSNDTGNVIFSLEDLEANGILTNENSELELKLLFNGNLNELKVGLLFPNPVGCETCLKLNLPNQNTSDFEFELFNVLGQKVWSKKEIFQTPETVSFRLVDSENKRLASGTYFLRVSGKNEGKTFRKTKKFTVLR
ncbi:T9SS type A sorting domain-containing protein [bacterium]|nr:T9SS type A sorting domain-containing protein [bacterium]